jgi:hypothetical protein
MMKSESMKDFVKMMAYFEKSPKVTAPNGAEKILGASNTTLEAWLKTQKKA